jgi:hypothetical protein
MLLVRRAVSSLSRASTPSEGERSVSWWWISSDSLREHWNEGKAFELEIDFYLFGGERGRESS